MAHVNIFKNGKLIKQKPINEFVAEHGYKINLGQDKSIELKAGENKTVGKFKFEVVSETPKPISKPQTNPPLDIPPVLPVHKESAAVGFIQQYGLFFSIFMIAIVLLVCTSVFFYLKMNESKTEVKNIQKKLQTQKQALTKKYLAAKKQANENQQILNIKGIKKFTLSGDELFAAGSAKVKPEAKKEIENIANQIKRNYPNCQVLVIGHTDSKPLMHPKTKKRFRDNWNLGAQRALAVLRIMQELKIPGEKLSAISRGSFHLKSNDVKSRRVEILLCPSEDKNTYEIADNK